MNWTDREKVYLDGNYVVSKETGERTHLADYYSSRYTDRFNWETSAMKRLLEWYREEHTCYNPKYEKKPKVLKLVNKIFKA